MWVSGAWNWINENLQWGFPFTELSTENTMKFKIWFLLSRNLKLLEEERKKTLHLKNSNNSTINSPRGFSSDTFSQSCHCVPAALHTFLSLHVCPGSPSSPFLFLYVLPLVSLTSLFPAVALPAGCSVHQGLPSMYLHVWPLSAVVSSFGFTRWP